MDHLNSMLNQGKLLKYQTLQDVSAVCYIVLKHRNLKSGKNPSFFSHSIYIQIKKYDILHFLIFSTIFFTLIYCNILCKVKNKNQPDATYCFIVLLIGTTCFGHCHAHHQEFMTIVLITTWAAGLACSPDT